MTNKASALLTFLLSLDVVERIETLQRCCGSHRWAKTLAERLNQSMTDQHLFDVADSIWNDMSKEDILEAFTHHPQIGADPEQLKIRFRSTQTWSANEQAGVSEASNDVIQRLAQGNQNYIDKFGYIFIVCATGKSAAQMLTLLEDRLPNEPLKELKIAAAEQAKITRIRLEKLL